MDAAPIESDSKAWQEWQQVVCFVRIGVQFFQIIKGDV
jgi:hypothetical protein